MMSLHQATVPLIRWKSSLNSAVFALTLFLCLCHTYGEEECLKSKVRCYECESTVDPNCKDPFNASLMLDSDLKLCAGCCVKVVRDRNTPKQSIWRTCTSHLHINLFMVDHVCMEESGGQGHMCFCESEACNEASPSIQPRATLVLVSIFTATFFLAEWPIWPIFRLKHCNEF